MAALSLALVNYLKPFLSISGLLQEKMAAVVIVGFFSWINYRGVSWAGITQNFFTIGSLIILAAFVVFGLAFGSGHWQNFVSPDWGAVPFTKMLGSPMIAVIFTFSGWFASAYVAGEVKNPERNLPLSLFLGTVIVTVLYTFMNITYLFAASISQLRGVINVAELSSMNLFNQEFALALSLAVILAIGSSLNATILAGSRLYYAMSKDAVFWPSLKRLHDRRGTPYISILVQGCMACVLILLGSFDQLLSYVVFAMLLSSIGSGIAHLLLRKRLPDWIRPYRTWGYPFIPLIFIGAYGWIAFEICREKPATSFIGLLIAFSGLPFYFYWRRLQKAEESTPPNAGPETQVD
jgi:APA family basic amino acid/polyamine antiporter